MFNWFEKKKVDSYPVMPYVLDLRYRINFDRAKKLNAVSVGIGVGNSGLAVQLPHIPFKRLDFVDVYKPYLERGAVRHYEAKNVRFCHGDARDFDFSNYDLVMMFDVLEHMPKDDSLAIMERVRCEQLIFIPLENEFRANNFEAEAQDHLSFWTQNDFKIRQYETEILYSFHHDEKNIWDALFAWK